MFDPVSEENRPLLASPTEGPTRKPSRPETRPHRALIVPVGLSRVKLAALADVLEGLGQAACLAGPDSPRGANPVYLIDIGHASPDRAAGPASLPAPAIALVGRSLPDIDQLFSAGFIDYVTYPFCPVELQRRLLSPVLESRDTMPEPVAATDRIVRAACRFMDARLERPISVEDLAARLGTNRTTLSRAFTSSLGMGPIAWLRRRRCEMASRLLRESAESILEIALSVGYSDPNNFSTAFRRLYGLSPQAFRKKLPDAKAMHPPAKAAPLPRR